jgi:hypothetical protein
MIVATVIGPKEHDAHSCDVCGLSYSGDHYGILLDNKKLAYFRLEEDGVPQIEKPNIPQECICHECMYHILIKEADGEKLRVKMVYFDNETYGEVDPEGDGNIF